MKKMFLFISIILLMFGFSANPNAINSSNKNKNESNIENNPLTYTEMSSIDVVWDDEEHNVPNNFIVTPTTATIEYEYNYSAKKIDHIIWQSLSTEIERYSVLEKDLQNDPKEDFYYNYKGTITATDLQENYYYQNNYLYAYEEWGQKPNSSSSKPFNFQTPIYNDENKGSFLEIENDDIETTSTEATVYFEFVPSWANYTDWAWYSWEDNNYDSDVLPLEAKWVTEDGTTTLGNTTELIPTGETFYDEEENKKRNIYSGTINTNTSVIKNRQSLENTKIIVYDEFATYEENETYVYESEPFTFSFNDDDEPSTITPFGDNAITTTQDSATIKYKIDLGTDGFGNEVKATNVLWKDNNPRDRVEFPSVSVTPPSPKKGIIIGEISTGKTLDPNEDYDTILEATLIDKKGNTSTITSETNIIVSTRGAEKGEVQASNLIYNFDDNNTSATIHYDIEPAKDEGGNNIEQKNISWVDEDKNNEIYTLKSEDIDESVTSGDLTADLTPGTDYKNTRLIVEDESPTPYSSEIIEEFTTYDEDKLGKVTLLNTNPIEETTQTEITINYVIEPANNIHASPIDPIKISWVEFENGDENNEKEFGGDLASEDIDKSDINDDGTYTGQLTASGLCPDQNYEYTKLKVEDGENPYYSDYLVDIETIPYDNVMGSVDPNSAETFADTQSSWATIGYDITPSTNGKLEPIHPTKISWIDYENEEKDVLTSESLRQENPDNEGHYVGELETKSLVPTHKYTSTKLVVTDGTFTYEEDVSVFQAAYQPELGTITSNPAITSSSDTSAEIDFTMTTSTDANDGEHFLFDEVEITWMIKKENGDIEKLGDGGTASYNEKTSNIEKGIYDGTIEVQGLDPYIDYDKTFLQVTDKTGTFDSRGGAFGEKYVPSFKTKESDNMNPGSMEQPEIVERKNDFVTISYNITPPIDEYGDSLEPVSITWYDQGDNPLATDTPTKDITTGHYIGQMTATGLEPNAEYENNYFIIDYNYEGDFKAELDLKDGTFKSDNYKFKAGNYKTQKMIIYGSVLAVIAVIFIIISIFVFIWWKKRRIN